MGITPRPISSRAQLQKSRASERIPSYYSYRNALAYASSLYSRSLRDLPSGKKRFINHALRDEDRSLVLGIILLGMEAHQIAWFLGKPEAAELRFRLVVFGLAIVPHFPRRT